MSKKYKVVYQIRQNEKQHIVNHNVFFNNFLDAFKFAKNIKYESVSKPLIECVPK